jgi:biofilm PGA synthesis N-glycosyltransferase PgaC
VEDSWDKSLKHDYRFANVEDVSGACQLFRRESFEAIGGYKPSKHGQVDFIATICVRMHGWETRVYTEKLLMHHRQQGTAQFNKFLVEFSNGWKDYMCGSDPLYAICRATYRLTKKPLILGGCLLFIGYFWAMLQGTEQSVSPEFTAFLRKEQRTRLGRLLRRQLCPEGLGSSRKREGAAR